MSSIPIFMYGFYFLLQTYRFGHGWKIGLSSIGVIIIGLGSFLFHGTMLRTGQLFDELPMLWSAVFFLFTVLTIDEPHGSRRTKMVGVGLAAYACANSAVYFAGGFVYFILAYILAVIGISVMTLRHVMRTDNVQHTAMKKFAFRAIGFYVGGFLLFWLPEQVLCGNQVCLHCNFQSSDFKGRARFDR